MGYLPSHHSSCRLCLDPFPVLCDLSWRAQGKLAAAALACLTKQQDTDEDEAVQQEWAAPVVSSSPR